MSPSGGAVLLVLLAALAVAPAPLAQVRGAPPPGAPPGQGRGTQTQQPQKPPPPLVTTGLIVGRVVDAATGRPVAGASVGLTGGAPPPPPVQMQPGAPRPAATPPAQPPRFLTDGEGRFAFRNLTRGTFNLNASKPGYADGAYGRFRPSGPTRPIQLADGERVGEITIRVFKMAVITGTVTDEAGEPVVAAQMRAYRRVLQGGRRVLVQNGTVSTDDRGMYRMGNLMPGEYVVSLPIVATSAPAGFGGGRPDLNFQMTANTPGSGFVGGGGGRAVTPDGRFLLNSGSASGNGTLAVFGPPEPSGRVLAYPTQYYSLAPSVGQATVIKLASGDERLGVDFVMRLVPTTTIAGMLFSPEGPASSYVLHLVPSDADSFSFDPDAATAVTDETGAFMFLGVPAGQYVIQTTRVSESMAMPPPPPPPPGSNIRTEQSVDPNGRTIITTITMAPNGTVLSQNRQVVGPPMLWAAAPIVVGDAGLEGVTLTLREGYKISGRVEFSGAGERPPPARLAQIPVMVEPADMRQRTNFQQPGRVGPDGTFTIAGLLPGRYLVRIGGAPGGWFSQSVTLGGVDVSDVPFELSDKDATGVVVTFTDRISDLRGTVRGQKEDAEPAAVIVYPADASAWKNFGLNPRRMRMVRASPAGAFNFGTLPPGDYLIAAVPDEYSGEWSDPAYLEILTRVALRVTLGEGERKVQEVEVHDVRPPGGGVPAPIAGARSLPVATAVEDLAAAEDADRRGPSVPDQTPPAQVRDRPLADPVGTGSISGVVLEDGSNRPVRRARVSARMPEMRSEMLATSDDEGRFAFTGLAPGPYTVFVTKPAYLAGFHGGTRPGRGPGVPLTLKAGQNLTGVAVRIARAGVISGVVMDQFGQPYASGRIRLMQVQRRDGERLLVGSGGAGTMMTDDRGAYRVYGLSPGTYAVGVMPAGQTGQETRVLSESEMRAALADLARKDAAPASPASAAADGTRQIPPAPPGPAPVAPLAGRALGLATVYYPGTVIETEATHLTIAPGQELSGIDFNVMLVPTSRIDGAVLMPDGQPAMRPQVQITSTIGGATTNATVRTNPDGTFQAVGVAPGRYAVIARMTGPTAGNVPTPPTPPTPPGVPVAPQSPPAPPGPTLWAQQELHVNGDDISGLVLTLGPTSTISGRVAFAGGSQAPSDGTGAVVSVSLDVFGPSRPGVSPRSVAADRSGTFTMSGVVPGVYRLSAFVQRQVATASGWLVQSAILDGRDVFEQAFEVHAGRDHQGAVVTLTDKAAELSGAITDGSGGPIAGLQILLFPTDRAEWRTNSRRTQGTTRSSAEGSYRFPAVRPGEYYLAAVTELEPGDWNDPAFMEQVAAVAIKLVFSEGEKKVQNLRAGG